NSEIDARIFDQRASPFVNFRVTIGKGEAAGAIMVVRREVNDLGCAHLVCASTLNSKCSVIDAVRMFVHKYPRFRGSYNHRLFVVNAPLGLTSTGAVSIQPLAPAEHLAHRYTA